MIRGARTQRRGLRAMILSACAKCPRARSTTQPQTVPRPKVLDHVHFHSVDDGMEVFAAQAEVMYRRDEPARARSRLARVERIDVGAPALKLLAPFSTRTSRIRDIVDLPAKGIDFKHGRTLHARQYPH